VRGSAELEHPGTLIRAAQHLHAVAVNLSDKALNSVFLIDPLACAVCLPNKPVSLCAGSRALFQRVGHAAQSSAILCAP
jgi:hypothetical protein